MAEENTLNILKQGVEAWNRWREENPGARPDLSGASLYGITHDDSERILIKGYVTPLSGVNLSGVDLDRAFIEHVDLSNADLSGATLSRVNLRRANLSGADLSGADLYEADLYQANLSGATLCNARLTRARLVETSLDGADLENCNVYGIAAWDVRTDAKTSQKNLMISDPSRTWEPPVIVDRLEVAQFIYLLLKNEKLREVIETMTSKAVLILGNFAPQRKEILESIRERLRERGHLPIMFDFEGPENRNLLDTVTTVARLSRYVIVDISQPRSVPAELEAIVPSLPSVPVQPLIEGSEEPYALFRDLLVRDSVLKLHRYRDLEDLLASFDEAVISPAETKLKGLEIARLRALEKLGQRSPASLGR